MMEFEEEHEEEEEEEEEDDEEMTLTPTYKPTTTTTSSGGSEKKPGGVAAPARYRECLKNHAVGIGGHAVDGCGEFMPAGADGTLDALKCAACNCHRNFHRKELLHLEPTPQNQLALFSPRPHHPGPHPPYHHHHHQPNQPHQVYNFYPPRGPAGYLHVSGQGQAQAQQQVRPLALPSPTGGGGSRETIGEQEVDHVMMGIGTMTTSSGKKRHRTKFTQEQKDKMLELAERLGWRIQKQDEAVVQQFCHETGVKRHVLKVWMHNNKHTLGKKP